MRLDYVACFPPASAGRRRNMDYIEYGDLKITDQLPTDRGKRKFKAGKANANCHLLLNFATVIFRTSDSNVTRFSTKGKSFNGCDLNKLALKTHSLLCVEICLASRYEFFSTRLAKFRESDSKTAEKVGWEKHDVNYNARSLFH